jgi:hypothetical protein
MGQGPNEVYLAYTICPYKNDIAFILFGHKIKIFTKKDNTYKWKETKWLKRDRYSHTIRDALFLENKWFFAGPDKLEGDKKKDRVALLKVYNNEGRPIARLIKKWFSRDEDYSNMDFYIAVHETQKNRAFVLAENELKTYEISTKQLKVLKEWDLEVPKFYKKMPEDFYNMKQYESQIGGSRTFLGNIHHWKISYSRITKIAVEGGYLVIQTRTCSDELKKFALLFYDINTLKLEKTFFIDDFFIGARDGKYYFYANGNPGLDEDIDECVINIYAFDKK